MQGACSLTYPLRHAQDPHCPRPLWLHHIFRYCLISGMIFENKKRVTESKNMFWFSLQLLFETVLILSRIKRDVAINLKTFSSTRYFCRILIKLQIFSTDFRSSLKYKISSKSVQLKPSCSTRTDGQMDMTKVIVAFRNFANAPKNSEGRDSANQQVVYLLVSTGQQSSVEDT
jgi:hypothetical protein